MRNAFIKALTEIAQVDDRIVLLTADMGFKIFDDFNSKCPNRFYNVGIAEANMASMASGLAMEGYKPFIYSISPFVTLRCYEQIRNDIAYHNRDVKIVGAGAGYSYGHNGATHHTIEDIALFRAMPNMQVICPGDPHETYVLTKDLCENNKPAYFRIGKAGEPLVHFYLPNIKVGKSFVVKHETSSDTIILSTGNILPLAAEIQKELKQKNIVCSLVSMPTVKPIDAEFLYGIVDNVSNIITLEEHNVLGGFGSSIIEFLAENDYVGRSRSFGIQDCFAKVSGDQNYLRNEHGLNKQDIVEEIVKFIGKQHAG